MSDLNVNPDGLRDGAARIAVSAEDLAAPIGLDTAGSQESHRGLAAFAEALNAAGARHAARLGGLSGGMRSGAAAIENVDHEGKDRFTELGS